MQPLNRRPRGGVVLALAVIGTLLSLQCSNGSSGRIHNIYELIADPTEDNLAKIRQAVDDPDRDVRATALNALVNQRVPDAERLALGGLRDEDAFVRATAAKLTADVGNPDNSPSLATMLLEDPHEIVRQRAAEALGRLGGEAALAGLAAGLSDPMENVRLASVRSVRELDPSFATAEVSRLLLSDPAWEIRVQAAGTLGASGSAEVATVLRAALEDPNEFVRSAADNALKLLGESDTGATGTDASATVRGESS